MKAHQSHKNLMFAVIAVCLVFAFCANNSIADTDNLRREHWYFKGTGIALDKELPDTIEACVDKYPNACNTGKKSATKCMVFLNVKTIDGVPGANLFCGHKDFIFLRYTGFIYIPEAGEYKIHVTADRGFHLKIGRETGWYDYHIPNAGKWNYTVTGEAQLNAGVYPFKLTYYDWEGADSLKLMWTPPDGKKQLIPFNIPQLEAPSETKFDFGNLYLETNKSASDYNYAVTRTFSFKNNGDSGTKLKWSLESNRNWITFSKSEGELGYDRSQQVTVRIDVPSAVTGSYSGTITLNSNHGTAANPTKRKHTITVNAVVYPVGVATTLVAPSKDPQNGKVNVSINKSIRFEVTEVAENAPAYPGATRTRYL